MIYVIAQTAVTQPMWLVVGLAVASSGALTAIIQVVSQRRNAEATVKKMLSEASRVDAEGDSLLLDTVKKAADAAVETYRKTVEELERNLATAGERINILEARIQEMENMVDNDRNLRKIRDLEIDLAYERTRVTQLETTMRMRFGPPDA